VVDHVRSLWYLRGSPQRYNPVEGGSTVKRKKRKYTKSEVIKTVRLCEPVHRLSDEQIKLALALVTKK
jgi:hypothetical protein